MNNHPLVTNVHAPDWDVYVGRPSKWGNPFIIGRDGTRNQVIDKYREWLDTTRPDLVKLAKIELKGKVLACHCAPAAPCHADVLAAIANDSESDIYRLCDQKQ